MVEQRLEGGIANAGQVVRVGPHVLRPSSAHSASVHAFLRAVRRTGFEGAPSPVGIDEDGRERLVFIDGEVPTSPYPDWAQTDGALSSIARLLRGLHDAARGFDPEGLTWDDRLADPAGGTLVCHNDVEPSNVVFRDGVAVALIDFEFAAPGRPVYDLAQLARLCVPIDDDFDQARLGWRPADRPARLRLVADAYGLDRDGRAPRCSLRSTMPSPASKQLSDEPSTPVIRTPWRCGIGPVAVSGSTAGAAGGPTTTSSSPPPCADQSRPPTSDVVRSRRDGALSSRNGLPDEV